MDDITYLRKQKRLLEKLTILKNVEIKKDENGVLIPFYPNKVLNDKLRSILKNEEVYLELLTNEYFSKIFWLDKFAPEIIYKKSNLIFRVAFCPETINSLTIADDVDFMIECASIPGMKTNFISYVGTNVSSSFEFIATMIMNCDENNFDFYIPGNGLESNFKYLNISDEILTNPALWDLLNAKIKYLHFKNNNFPFILFDKEKEIRLARKSAALKKLNN